MKKTTIASVGLAAAATAGALLLTGSPASAQTTQTPGTAQVRTSMVADHYANHHRADHWRHHWGHHRYHDHYRWNRHVYVGDDRIVIRSDHTSVSVG